MKSRSALDMAVIGPSKNTRPERVVRMALVRWRVRHRLHEPIPGKPDLFIPRLRLCVFVNGRFWHCASSSRMRRLGAFWRAKLKANVRRDRRVRRLLRARGYRTLTVWDDGLTRGLARVRRAAGLPPAPPSAS